MAWIHARRRGSLHLRGNNEPHLSILLEFRQGVVHVEVLSVECKASRHQEIRFVRKNFQTQNYFHD